MSFKLSESTKIILMKRLKSLLWRTGGMVAIVIVDFAGESIGLFNLPILFNVCFGLVLGEVSKFLNSNFKDLQKVSNSER